MAAPRRHHKPKILTGLAQRGAVAGAFVSMGAFL